MQLRDMAQASIFGRPGHGAPTNDIRKKKFTEYQLDIANKPDFDGEKEDSYNPTIASIRYSEADKFKHPISKVLQ